MDAFSEILSGVKLHGALFFSAEFSAPWGFTTPGSDVMAATLGLGTSHLVMYHFVIDGGAIVELADGGAIELQPGDVVIFPHGDPHHMSSGRAMARPFPNYGITAKVKARDLSPLHAGGGGEASRFVCGYMTCDPYLSRPILNGLPPVFKVNIRTDRSGQWLENSIMHLVEEAASGQVGSEAMLAKLSEALFVDTLRRYIAGLPDQQVGWLAGTRDPDCGEEPGAAAWADCAPVDDCGAGGRSWHFAVRAGGALHAISVRTADDVHDALEAATRRAVAGKDVAGRGGDCGGGGVMNQEAAFNRAFKREFGQPPGRYRIDHKAAKGRAQHA